MKKFNIADLIFFICLIYSLICLFFNIQLNIISAILLLGLVIYSVIKSRKNVLLFFSFLVIGYFIFSVLISRFFFIGGPLQGEFFQLRYNNTNSIGINCILLFYSIILLLIRKFKKVEIDKNFFKYDKYNKKTLIVSLGIIFLVTFIFLNNVFFKFFSNSEQIYEYCLILFIFGYYYTGNNKKLWWILSIILALFSGYTILQGVRVSILQMLIIFFLMNMIHKYNYKKIAIFTIIGIILFTIFGIYGDHLDWGTDFSFNYIYEQILDRKFALDTSVSSYFTGLTFIEYTNIMTFGERFSNLLDYFKYTFIGGGANYKNLQSITINSYIHYYGGYITSYFYYWLGTAGVILIATYIGKLFKMINNLTLKSKHFYKLSTVYIISTIPRWFLYFPTPLFRGFIIFLIIHIAINIFISGEKNEES